MMNKQESKIKVEPGSRVDPTWDPEEALKHFTKAYKKSGSSFHKSHIERAKQDIEEKKRKMANQMNKKESDKAYRDKLFKKGWKSYSKKHPTNDYLRKLKDKPEGYTL